MDKTEKTLKENLVYDGKIVKLYSDDIVCSNGNKSKREYVKHNGGACCLALHDGLIYFVRQYRYAYHKELLELPAGKIEIGENPDDSIVRELEEEIGFKSHGVERISYMYPSCGYTNEIIYLYYSPVNDLTETHPDEDEVLDIVKLTPEEAYKLLDNGEIHDAKTMILMETLRNRLLK